MEDSIDVVKMLLQKNKSFIKDKASNKNTGFILACRRNSLKTVEFLM